MQEQPKFTSKFERTLALANDCALELNHTYIGADHLLVALTRTQTSGALTVMRNVGAKPAAVANKVLSYFPKSTSATARKQLTLTPQAGKAIDSAVRLAREYGHNEVGTEHLLGSLAIGESLPSRVLSEFGITASLMRDQILKVHGQDASRSFLSLPYLFALVGEWGHACRQRMFSKAESGPLGIFTLHKKGLATASGSGVSIESIRVQIANLTDRTLEVRIPHGTYFIADGGHQNMVTRQDRRVSVDPNAKQSFLLPASCINASRPIPSDRDGFKGVGRVSRTLRRFLEAAEAENTLTVQAGVWAITDGLDSQQLRDRLILRQSATDDAVSRSANDRPAISPEHIARAKTILDKLGISHRLR